MHRREDVASAHQVLKLGQANPERDLVASWSTALSPLIGAMITARLLGRNMALYLLLPLIGAMITRIGIASCAQSLALLPLIGSMITAQPGILLRVLVLLLPLRGAMITRHDAGPGGRGHVAAPHRGNDHITCTQVGGKPITLLPFIGAMIARHCGVQCSDAGVVAAPS